MAGKKIDINTATVNDLEFLAGVGHHRAEAIVKHRKVGSSWAILLVSELDCQDVWNGTLGS